MDLGLTGKRALVLASSQGLGLGIASKLCCEGANVVLSGRSVEKMRVAAGELTSAGPGTASYVECDLSRTEAAADLYTAACQELGDIDILINNSGGPPPGGVAQPDSAMWRQQIDSILVRIIEISNLCIGGMQERGWGRVLTLASSGIVQPIPNLAMSNTVRAALVGWNKTLSNEVAAFGVTTNILAPGRIHTQRVDQLDAAAAKRQGKTVEEVAAASRAGIPMGRYGRVAEFAAVAAFLVSEPASYVTGSVVRCDGGIIRSS